MNFVGLAAQLSPACLFPQLEQRTGSTGSCFGEVFNAE